MSSVRNSSPVLEISVHSSGAEIPGLRPRARSSPMLQISVLSDAPGPGPRIPLTKPPVSRLVKRSQVNKLLDLVIRQFYRAPKQLRDKQCSGKMLHRL